MRGILIFTGFLLGLSSFNFRRWDDRYHDYMFWNYKKFEKELVLISENAFSDTSKTAKSFYICPFEVSNKGYRKFLSDLREQDSTQYILNKPDSMVWAIRYDDVAVNWLDNMYFLNPHYNHYPVVGITYEQANAYCKWLTADYAKIKQRKFKNAVFKLPTKEQWEAAAYGPKRIGISLQDSTGRWKANFRRMSQYSIVRNQDCLDSVYDYRNCTHVINTATFSTAQSVAPVPVDSYLQTQTGLFNLVGNVEEYVLEKGITKGGSYSDSGYFLRLDVDESYSDDWFPSSRERGFRIVMEVTTD